MVRSCMIMYVCSTSLEQNIRTLVSYNIIIYHLDGGIPPPLKNMKVSWDYYSQYMDDL